MVGRVDQLVAAGLVAGHAAEQAVRGELVRVAVELLQGGHEGRSSSFSGQPDCPGIRKSVRFPLQQGEATMQISGSAASSIKVDLLPAE